MNPLTYAIQIDAVYFTRTRNLRWEVNREGNGNRKIIMNKDHIGDLERASSVAVMQNVCQSQC